MANKITLTTSSYDGRYMQLVCEQTKDIANNQSTIKWTLSTLGGSVNYYATGATIAKVNNVVVYEKARVNASSAAFPAAKGSTSGTLTVKHNPDGSLTIPVYLETAIYTSTKRTASNSWTLDTIPRGAAITSAPDFNDEQTSITINYTNTAGAAVDKIDACIAILNTSNNTWYDTGAAYREISKTATSYTFNLTAENITALRKAVTAQDGKLKVRFYLRTNIDGNNYFNNVEKTFSLINFEPTITPTILDINEISTQLTQNPQKIIKGFNTIQYNIGAAARKEATITNQHITCGAQTTTNATGILENVSSGLFELRTIDNRNTITEKTVELELIEYIPLTCSFKASIELEGETTSRIKFSGSGKYWAGNFGAVDNEVIVKYRLAENGGDYGELIDVGATANADSGSYSFSGIISSLNYKSSYKLQIVAFDKVCYNGIEAPAVSLKTIPAFGWNDEGFNFNVPILINEIEQDYIVESGTSGIWTYEKWASGKAVCWGVHSVSVAANTLWQNGVYIGNSSSRADYPFTFKEIPLESATLLTGGYSAWQYCKSRNTTSATGDYNVARFGAVSSAQTFYFNFYVVGKWR
jgi:hypothetical protein